MRPSARPKPHTSTTQHSKKPLPSQIMERETQQMEEKLAQLKRQMASEKELREN